MKPIYLFSRRFSISRGWHWKIEREVTKENAEEWQRVFAKDEPEVIFYVGIRHPSDNSKIAR